MEVEEIVTNPYAFVPLGETEVKRGKPTGHDKLGEKCLSGSFLVDILVRTPMLIGEAVEGQSPPRAIGGTGDEATIIPGSTLAGSIRSVHESLTNSCLRILDLDYVPVHRQFMSNGATSGLRLALVTGCDTEGLPKEVELLGDPILIDSRCFDSVAGYPRSTDDPGGGVAYSGMRLSISENFIAQSNYGARRVEQNSLPQGVKLHEESTGPWVLYVSDTKARPGARVWFRAGKLPAEQVKLFVSEDVRRSLARAIEGAFDMHFEPFRVATGDYLNVYTPADAKNAEGDDHAGPVIGRRRRVHPGMFPPAGSSRIPVWVALNGDNRITEIRLSQAWRVVGAGEMDRRARGWAPCRQPDHLCPSCAVFGSAGVDAANPSRGAQQSSYRGHVRLEDARHNPERARTVSAWGMAYTSPIVSAKFQRAPLGSPKPTAGQFYLDSGTLAGATDGSKPLAQWGSSADGQLDLDGRPSNPRPLAGRKFYWATSWAGDPSNGRGAMGEGDAANMVSGVHVVMPTSGFTARITVDNLTVAQIGGLLAAIDPRLLGQGWEGCVGRLGGGRPFGWGAVTMHIDPQSVDLTGPCRYTDDKAGTITVAELVEAFLDVNNDVAHPGASSPISQLRHILTLDAVSDSDVTYPGQGHPDRFAPWRESSGIAVRVNGVQRNRPLGKPPRPLPDEMATS